MQKLSTRTSRLLSCAALVSVVVAGSQIPKPVRAESPKATPTTEAAPKREGLNVTLAKPETSETVEDMQQLLLAQNLIAYGRQQKSPTALLTAVQILLETPSVEEAKEKTSKTDETPTETVAKTEKPSPSFDPKALLAEVKTMAGGDQAVLTLAKQLEQRSKTQGRGRVGGPSRHVGAVNARSSDIYKIRFRGGRSAKIIVNGDRDTDLDCAVYDESGNLIVADRDRSDVCVLAWRPRWTGPFVIQIKNLGRVYNRYVLLTN